MLIDYIKPNSSKNFENFEVNTRSLTKTAVFGVSDNEKFVLASCVQGRVLYIAKDNLKAKKVAEEVSYLTGEKTVYLPPKDDVLLFKKAFNKDSLFARLSALYDILLGARFISCSFEALLQLMPKDILSLTFKKGEEYNLTELVKSLVSLGYSRNEFISSKGEFSIRGDILEIFPINGSTGVRCDFFGDELEQIRLFDAYNQKPMEEINEFSVIQCYDFKVENGEEVKKKLDISLKNFGVLLAKSKAKQIVDELKEIIDSKENRAEISFIAPLLNYSQKGIFNYFNEEVTVIFDEAKFVNENILALEKEHAERVLTLQRSGQAFDFTFNHYLDHQLILKEISSCKTMAFQLMTTEIPFFKVLNQFRFNTGRVSRYHLKFDELFIDLKNWVKSAYKVVICCGSKERAERLAIEISKNNIICQLTDAPSNFPGVYVLSNYLTGGVIFHEGKVVVIGTCDLYLGAKDKKKVRLRRKDTFDAPNVGDFAVHEKHGIGVVRGTEKITSLEGTKDYIALEYLGGDVLYVPVEQLDRLTKYLGSEKPRLSKIGGTEFEKIKERVRQSIREMSINLKKLYAERAEKKGFAFSEDNELSNEFDLAFEFDETEDQLQSIKEIKADMESEKVMDRLLCGDVGFGKTEVALRACFKAVMDSKQVAFVGPTTILTQQHYETCLKRFEGFGVRIALLNRFVSPQKTKQIIKDIANGEIDIVIGTHKLFSKDIKFKDLGLLILDEEQCFGVEHKEKLRVLKTNVDTLTMTATPIPRTLHMSLSGIRDISLINTPPVSRIPVQAYVVEEDDSLICDAINREVARGGQVFVLYNKVESIYSFTEHLQKLLPEIRFVIGHGQMQKSLLESNILSFYQGEYDVLVSTTIIENGIDLPSANTLIVIEADKLGLFTLYQLKGRVGRSDKMAHAYFTYKGDKILGETAYKRLSALMEHTELGSGYKIAMRDLEIRGAGNIMGREQHGHMDKIGYELYSKLLKEQLGEVTKDYETELDIRIDAFIPENYVEVASSRLDVYKAISEISYDEKEKITQSLTQTYGKLPREVENLILIATFKSLASKMGIKKAVVSQKECYMQLINFESIANLQDGLERFRGVAVLSFDNLPKISFESSFSPTYVLSQMIELLHFSLKNVN